MFGTSRWKEVARERERAVYAGFDEERDRLREGYEEKLGHFGAEVQKGEARYKELLSGQEDRARGDAKMLRDALEGAEQARREAERQQNDAEAAARQVEQALARRAEEGYQEIFEARREHETQRSICDAMSVGLRKHLTGAIDDLQREVEVLHAEFAKARPQICA